LHAIQKSPDVTTKTVFFEDSAALTGLALAATGLGVSELTGNDIWDAVASIGIGCVLAGVSLMLGLQSRHLLLGAAAGDETRRELHRILASFPEVDHVVRLLSMQLGSHSVLVTGELEVRRDLTTAEIESLIERIDQAISRALPEVRETFWELRSRPGAVREAPARGEPVDP
jgi:divalent metal cation (Fe/Co/Zn/Cd) transporter